MKHEEVRYCRQTPLSKPIYSVLPAEAYPGAVEGPG